MFYDINKLDINGIYEIKFQQRRERMDSTEIYAIGDVSAVLSAGDIVICKDLDDLVHTAKGLMDAGYDMILNSKKLTIEIMEV